MQQASPSAPVSPLEDLVPPDAGPARPQLVLVASVSALVLFIGLGVRREAPLIEQDIRDRATAALAEAGMDWSRLRVDGRDVTLTGGAPSDAARTEAYRLAEQLEGVRIVHDETTQAPEPAAASGDVQPQMQEPARRLPYALLLSSDGAHLTLSGEAPDDAETTRLVELAGRRFAVADVTDMLSRGANSAPGDWTRAAAAALDALVLLERGEARLTEQRLEVSGLAADPSLRARTRQLLQRGLPATFTSHTDIALAAKIDATPSACQEQIDSLLGAAGVEFDGGSAALRPDAVPVLEEVVEIAQSCSPVRFEIAGHTDDRGDPTRNLTLSQARAETVMSYLVEQGVAPSRMTARGYGESRPLARGTSPESRAKNRRIEIRIARSG